MVPHLDTVATVRSIEHELALKQVGQRPRLAVPWTMFLPVACLLALGSGVGLLILASTLDPPDVSPVVASVPSADAATAVHAFYAAANNALRTGDPTSLAAVVAPDLLEHADRPGLPPGRVGLVRYLALLREAYPTLRFEVEDVLAEGELVSTRVTAQAPASSPLPGGLAAQDERWSGVDVFRVVDGRVAERWSGTDAPSTLQPLARMPLDAWPRGSSATAFARLTVTPGAEIITAAFPGPGLVVIEAGTLVVRGSGTEGIFRAGGSMPLPRPDLLRLGTDLVLAPGDVVTFPSGSSALSLHSVGPDPAMALAVAWLPSPIDQSIPRPPKQLGMSSLPAGDPTGAEMLAAGMLLPMDGGRVVNLPGITVTPLGSLGTIDAAQVPAGRVVVTLDRVILAPGTSLPPGPAKGPVLLTIETGAVALVPIRETARLRLSTGKVTTASAGSEAALDAGDSAFWDAGAVALLRTEDDTPGIVLLLSITADAPVRPPPP